MKTSKGASSSKLMGDAERSAMPAARLNEPHRKLTSGDELPTPRGFANGGEGSTLKARDKMWNAVAKKRAGEEVGDVLHVGLTTFRCKTAGVSPVCRIPRVQQRRQIVDFSLDTAGVVRVDS